MKILVILPLISFISSCKKEDTVSSSDVATLVSRNATTGKTTLLFSTMIRLENSVVAKEGASQETSSGPGGVDVGSNYSEPEYCWYAAKDLTDSQIEVFEGAVDSGKNLTEVLKPLKDNITNVNASYLTTKDAYQQIQKIQQIKEFTSAAITETDLADSVSQTENKLVDENKMEAILNILKGLEKTSSTQNQISCPRFAEDDPNGKSLSLNESEGMNLADPNSCKGVKNVIGNGASKCCSYAWTYVGQRNGQPLYWISQCTYKFVYVLGRPVYVNGRQQTKMEVKGFWHSPKKRPAQ